MDNRKKHYRARTWRKQCVNMDASCFLSTYQPVGLGIMLWNIYSWHILEPLLPIEDRLNTAAYQGIGDAYELLFMSTVHPFSRGYFTRTADSLVNQTQSQICLWNSAKEFSLLI